MNYKEVIEAKYNREAWQQLLHDIFLNKVQFYNSTSEVKVNSRLAKSALYIGRISLSDGESLGIYEVELADKVDIERNKRGIRDMLTKDWKDMGHAGAFMFCYRKNESVLRFSYVSETWGFNKKGDYEKLSTNTKRYTYLLGEGRGCRTAIEQFCALKESKQSLSDVTAAFSVEALTKQFYKDLFDWYQWAVDPASGVYFPNNTSTEDDDRADIETKIIRMITRIMFVWFIKQKDLVPDKIFDADFLSTILKDFNPESKEVGNYYNAILQNLFFATLNRAIEDEQGNKRRFATNVKKDIKTLYRYPEMFKISEDEVVKMFSEVPFLNGGLFECLDKTKTIDGVEQAYNYDGFSRNDKKFADGRYRNRAVVPNILFFDEERGLISILSRYNFTIEENSPEEQQVALDPELLGKVFENLLGAYNPETRETARNQSGSFYTPREIVNYMVDESLISYLGNTAFVRSLFSPEFSYDKTKTDEYKAIADKLKAIKILDPACGSGAFPMGLLNRMIDILGHISPEENTYDLKLSIIENCIYGSDIQSIAAQITKLRFFISLICNCEKDASKPNFGIPTLPNLETKFVAANSLIAKKRQTCHSLFENPEIEPTKQALTEIRHEHFAAKTANRKSTLRQKDKELREKLARLLAEDNDFAPADAKQLADWNPYDQNAVADFFDPEWMFGVSDGFDIVIGNPPYIQLQNDGGKLAKLYADCNYKTFARTGDIYCLFYERGYQLLKPNGHLCYITSNKWMRAGYGEKTRDFFARNTNPMLLIDFAGVKIFESATVDTNILLFAKAANEHKTWCAVANKQNKDSVKNLSVFVQQTGTECDFSGSDSWVILSPIEQSIKRKIEAVGTPLKDWDINIYRGVLTGYNEAFIISTEKREEILANCQTENERKRTAELIRPILRGRDIKRYGYNWANLWLIYIPWHFPYQFDETIKGASVKAEKAFKEQYPAVYNHMLQYKEPLSKRNKAETGIRYEWYAMQRWGAKYWEDFNKPKMLWKRVGSILRFCYNDNETLGLDSTCFATGKSIEFICCVLNSPMGHYLLKDAPKTGTGDLLVSVQAIEPIRLPQVGSETNSEFKKLLERLIKMDTPSNEKEISCKVFKLYDLSLDEQSYIETNFT